MSHTARNVCDLSTQPPEKQIPIMIALGYHLRSLEPESPNAPKPNRDNLRTALILAIKPSEENFGLLKLPSGITGYLTTLSSNINSSQTKSEPLQLPPTPTHAPEDLATGRQAMIDTWNTCCLLYTSPSPRDLSTSRMPSSA